MGKRRIATNDLQVRINKRVYDKNNLIEPTPFNVKDNLTHINMFRIVDASDDAVEYLDGYSYNRDKYFTASMDYDYAIRNLSKKAFILFEYIKNNIDYGSNYIVLNTDTIGEIIDEKHKANIYARIKELIDNNLIARSHSATNKNTYVINHNLFFIGSYNKFVNDYNHIYTKTESIENK